MKVRGDGRCKEAEAYWNLGIAAERRKEFNKALSFFEKFHSIARGKSWVTESGVKFHNAACDCLQRIYVTLSEMVIYILFSISTRLFLSFLHFGEQV